MFYILENIDVLVQTFRLLYYLLDVTIFLLNYVLHTRVEGTVKKLFNVNI